MADRSGAFLRPLTGLDVQADTDWLYPYASNQALKDERRTLLFLREEYRRSQGWQGQWCQGNQTLNEQIA